jgi:DNA-binding HxlR family transcriptional regulator
MARAAEVFAERWTPVIVRNLLTGCETFGEIEQGAPGIPRSVLAQRLRQLERHGVVERRRAGRRSTYHLTDCGLELNEVCYALGVWGARWLDLRPEHLDPFLVVWFWARLVERDRLPKRRVVVRFDLTDGSRPDRYWVLLTRQQSEVCMQPPGFDEDLVMTGGTEALVRWHTGRAGLAALRRSGQLTLTGSPSLTREFARWGGLSPFAGIAPAGRPATARPAS